MENGPGITQPAAPQDAQKQLNQTPEWAEHNASMMTEKRDFGSFATTEKSYSERSGSNTGSEANLGGHGEMKTLEHVDTTYTTYEQANNGLLYRDGKLVLQPAPSQDPKDPLNLSFGRKLIAVACLCFFGKTWSVQCRNEILNVFRCICGRC